MSGDMVPDCEREAIHALRRAHSWLEPAVDGITGLDHVVGERDDACLLCHAVAALEGRVVPRSLADDPYIERRVGWLFRWRVVYPTSGGIGLSTDHVTKLGARLALFWGRA